jgi:hypothetical protein
MSGADISLFFQIPRLVIGWRAGAKGRRCPGFFCSIYEEWTACAISLAEESMPKVLFTQRW